MNSGGSKLPLLKSTTSAEQASQTRALIFLVSPPRTVPLAKETTGGVTTLILPGISKDQTHRVGGRSLREEIRALDDFGTSINRHLQDDVPKWSWNWQQMLRALRDHDHLEQVWLVGSKGSQGSRMACDQFCLPWIRAYLPPKCQVHTHEPGIDFEDYNGVEGAIREIVFENLSGYQHREITVDITGGQKVASIAGAAMTMNRELTFQYVQTNPPFHTIHFDIVLDDVHFHGGVA